MSNYNFNYSFNISGNCNAVVQEIAENVGNLRTNLTQTEGMLCGISDILELIDPISILREDVGEYNISVALNQFTDYLGNLRNSFAETMAPGAALNASLADLAAISGATGKELDTVEKFARRTAREFGGSASGAVESYKLLLSQLSPELTKNTEALDAMGRNVAILSKTMGGDTTAAAEVLTTAMNQYGVSLKDPMEASRQMADMMNIMAAAGREGSAELPTIKVALEQCGMAAKAAGVSFAETNAAIQVLDKAGKKGSEGGVALRNVMATLAQGRFLPKDVQQELAAAGVSINDLTDQSKTLAERLTILKPVMAATVIKEKRNRGKKFSISTNLHLAKIAGAETGRRDAESFYEKNPTHSALQSAFEVSRMLAGMRVSMARGIREASVRHIGISEVMGTAGNVTDPTGLIGAMLDYGVDDAISKAIEKTERTRRTDKKNIDVKIEKGVEQIIVQSNEGTINKEELHDAISIALEETIEEALRKTRFKTA